ncbi:putative sugar kinase YdjH [termite gut metagenome]|uniref:Putative sugar kinase YdjH n=1 Tax=termite gut metagenome TaxID=433724 RepID=A0A5J4R8E3_9ZZZZ
MDKIIGIGNALIDILVSLKDDAILQEMNLPKGSMQLIDDSQRIQINQSINQMNIHLATGGAAGNTIRGLACLGIATGFIGKIGKDEYGTFYRESLQKNGIEDKLLTSDLSSGIATTFILPDGERTFGTYLGAASALKAKDLTLDMFKGYTYLFIEGYLVQDHDMILRAIELAKEVGLQICLDMASYNIVENDRDFFFLLVQKYVDIVFANEDEARAFTGKESKEALEIISKICSIAVVKLGANGAYIRKGTEEIKVEALPITKVTDTTGAGDYFAAGFLYGLTCGYSLEKCGKIGSILSGNIIQVIGTTLSTPKWDDIKLRISEVISE